MASSLSSSTRNKKQQNTSKLEKKQQIPTKYNQEQTLRTIRKQEQINGQTRTKTVNDFPYAAAITQMLKDLEFPADKEKIINFILQQQTKDAQSTEILSVLQQIEEKRQSNNITDITKAAELVQ
jgi:predicted SPOUT superfamily RNA methylase MTH1